MAREPARGGLGSNFTRLLGEERVGPVAGVASALTPRANRTITPTATPNETRDTMPRAPQSIFILTVIAPQVVTAATGGAVAGTSLTLCAPTGARRDRA